MPDSPERADTIKVPLSWAQWIGGGAMIALMTGSSAYVGTTQATSPEVVGLQISVLAEKVDELDERVQSLGAGLDSHSSRFLTREEYKDDQRDIEERLRQIEGSFPDSARRR